MIQREDGTKLFIFDSHVHLGGNALVANYGYEAGDFTGDDVIKKMDEAGVDRIVGFPVANPHTDYSRDNLRILEWSRQYPGRIVPFARLQPFFEDRVVADVARYAGLGVKGLKLHPRADGGYNLNDARLVHPIICEAAKHNLVVLFHTGETYNCAAGLLADLAMDYPTVRFICAHMGMDDSYLEAMAFARRLDNLWVDTTNMWPPPLIRQAVRKLGPEKVLYGSDMPYILPTQAELDKVMKHALLTEQELRLVMGENIARILGMPLPA